MPQFLHHLKPILFIAIVLLCSCTGPILKPDQAWQLSMVKKQQHTFNQSGNLDSSHCSETFYYHDTKAVETNLLVTRTYDNSQQLMNERTYDISSPDSDLVEEIIYQYDSHHNPVLEITKDRNVINSVIRKTYNYRQQIVEEISIYKQFDIEPADWTMDSVVAHKKDKHITKYDTIIRSHQYDTTGNLILELGLNTRHQPISRTSNQFNGKGKTISFDINQNGDTTSMTVYQKNGNRLTEDHYAGNKLLRKRTCLYEAGHLIEEINIDKRTNHDTKETLKYDAEGNQVESRMYKSDIE